MLTIDKIIDQESKWREMAIYLNATEDMIDDVIQEMYVKILEIERKEGSLERIENDGEVNKFYVFKIIQSCVVNEFRRQNRYVNEEIELVNVSKNDKEEHKYAELMETIKYAINDLNEYDLMILELYFVNGYSLRKLSKGTGIPTHSIYHTLKNIKQIIKNKSEQKFNEYIKEKTS